MTQMQSMHRAPANLTRDLPSFGRRRGRKLSLYQAQLVERLSATPHVDLATPPPDDLTRLFAHEVADVWLEIGPGGGEHLLAQAAAHPDIGLIASEPFLEGVVKVLSRMEADGIGNIMIHPDDVRPLLRWLPEGCVGRTFILFPDPWPKRRHVKRRLVSAGTLGLLARVMRPGAELRISTDIGDYARTALIAMRDCGAFEWQAHSTRDWRIRPEDQVETRYEQKANREGRIAYHFRFRRK
ncbi:MAG: hypothetical protein RLZ98_442 [Pseudomonadota bacterium]|jgi:tRNA (guanine-N7-)-methyltransferase